MWDAAVTEAAVTFGSNSSQREKYLPSFVPPANTTNG